MLAWIAANAANIVILLVVAGCVFLAGRSVYRNRGNCHCGTGGCSSCGGHCGSCSGCASGQDGKEKR